MTNLIKNIEPQSFDIQVWFRYGQDEKDCENYQVTAHSLEEAAKKAESNHRFVIASYYNGQKINA